MRSECIHNEFEGDGEAALHVALDIEDSTTEGAGVFGDLVDAFPGLANGEEEVNGGDLVAWMTENLSRFGSEAGHERGH